MSVLPTIEESPEVKVHCLSSNSDSEGDNVSDSKDHIDGLWIESTNYDKLTSRSDGENFDSRLPPMPQSLNKLNDGNLKVGVTLMTQFIPLMTLLVRRPLRRLCGLARLIGFKILMVIVTLLLLKPHLVPRY